MKIRLEGLQNLYECMYVSEGLFENADCTKWQATEGGGVLTGLKNSLEEAQAMNKRKYNIDADEEEGEGFFEDVDGTK